MAFKIGDMNSVSSIALSGMHAASVRMQVSASRIANLSATAAQPETSVTRASDGDTAAGIVTPFKPDARFSASYGLLSGPDIDLAGEIIEHLIASTSFIAVAQVIRADSKMIESLLDITA